MGAQLSVVLQIPERSVLQSGSREISLPVGPVLQSSVDEGVTSEKQEMSGFSHCTTEGACLFILQSWLFYFESVWKQ